MPDVPPTRPNAAKGFREAAKKATRFFTKNSKESGPTDTGMLPSAESDGPPHQPSTRVQQGDVAPDPTSVSHVGPPVRHLLTLPDEPPACMTRDGKKGKIAPSRRRSKKTPTPQNPEKPDAATCPTVAAIGDLWEKAYSKIKESGDVRKYIAQYEALLIKQSSPGQSPSTYLDRQQQMVSLIKTQSDELKDSRWAFVISGRKVEVKDIVDSIINGIIYAKGAVESIMRGNGEPHAAMAWAGVCVLLPLILRPHTQQKDAIKLLGVITERINRYHVVEETFRCPLQGQAESARVAELRASFVDKTIALYEEILVAQVRLACTYARSTFLQYGRDVLLFDDWESITKKLDEKHRDIQTDVEALDQARNLSISQALAKLSSDLDSAQSALLAELNTQTAILQAEQNRKCLQALSSSLDYRGTKARVAQRVQGTFEWFLNDPNLLTLRDSATCETLLVTAGAGCGKSVLLKYLADELVPRHRTLAPYFFFHQGDRLQESALECLKSLLHQMICAAPYLISIAQAKFAMYEQNLSTQFEELWDIFEECINRYDGEVICIVDGLDECRTLHPVREIGPGGLDREREEEESHERLRFFDKMASLKSSVDGRAKLILSVRSGSEDEIAPFHTHASVVDITKDEKHTADDLSLFIAYNIESLVLQDDVRRFLKNEIEKLQTKSRTYLWLDLIFKWLAKPQHRNRSTEYLKELLRTETPTSVDRAFRKLLPDDHWAEAAAILRLVLSARRQLTLEELSEAFEFATKETMNSNNAQDGEAFAKTLVTYCGAFLDITTVQIDPAEKGVWGQVGKTVVTKRTVDFFHQEARHFLARASRSADAERFYKAFDPEDCEGCMRTTCVRYLRFYGDKQMHTNLSAFYNHSEVLQWLSKYLSSRPFMCYAAVYWIYHLPFETDSPDERKAVADEISTLCDISSPHFLAWFMCCWRLWTPGMDLKQYCRIYTCAFITDHLHPSEEVKREFNLKDPIEDPAEKWWYWTASNGFSTFLDLAKKCERFYYDEDARPIYFDVPTQPLPPPEPEPQERRRRGIGGIFGREQRTRPT